MIAFGLTGGIGMGKSAAAAILAARGLPVVDSDDLARQVVAPGQPALEEIRQAFGNAIIGQDGALKRSELGRIVFADPEARRRLEAITHPPIRKAWQHQLARWRSEGHLAAIAVIPLLFETNAETHFDRTICVACSPRLQWHRLQCRGWDDVTIRRRLAAQWPIERKMACATLVAWNDGNLEVLAAQLARMVPE